MKNHENKNTSAKNPWRWACLGLSIVCGLLFLYSSLSQLFPLVSVKLNEAASIGIIGGADGPTAVFVTGPNRIGYQPTTMYALLTAMGLIGFFALRKLPRKEKGE